MKLYLFFALAAFACCERKRPICAFPEMCSRPDTTCGLDILPAQDTFTGKIAIDVQVKKTTPIIWLNSAGLKIVSGNVDGKPAKVVAGSNDAFVGIEGGAPFQSRGRAD